MDLDLILVEFNNPDPDQYWFKISEFMLKTRKNIRKIREKFIFLTSLTVFINIYIIYG